MYKVKLSLEILIFHGQQQPCYFCPQLNRHLAMWHALPYNICQMCDIWNIDIAARRKSSIICIPRIIKAWAPLFIYLNMLYQSPDTILHGHQWITKQGSLWLNLEKKSSFGTVGLDKALCISGSCSANVAPKPYNSSHCGGNGENKLTSCVLWKYKDIIEINEINIESVYAEKIHGYRMQYSQSKRTSSDQCQIHIHVFYNVT